MSLKACLPDLIGHLPSKTKKQNRTISIKLLQVDQSGRGVLAPADINGFLNELGLEPTSSDVLHIIDELDWSGSGIVSRYATTVVLIVIVCSSGCTCRANVVSSGQCVLSSSHW